MGKRGIDTMLLLPSIAHYPRAEAGGGVRLGGMKGLSACRMILCWSEERKSACFWRREVRSAPERTVAALVGGCRSRSHLSASWSLSAMSAIGEGDIRNVECLYVLLHTRVDTRSVNRM